MDKGNISLKTIIQAHADALEKAKPECHFAAHAEKAIQVYLKEMLDAGYVLMPKDADVTLEELKDGDGS